MVLNKTRSIKWIATAAIALACGLPVTARAQQDGSGGGSSAPTTRPERRNGGGGGGAQRGELAQRMRRLHMALEQLNLTDQQKKQAEEVFASTREKLQGLREEAKTDREAARQHAQAIGQELREQLREILTPEQRQKLREIMESERGGGATTGTSGNDENSATPTTKPAADAPGAQSSSATLRVGELAPQIALIKTDGRPTSLSDVKGRPILVVFGSYSSPTFRARADALDKLADDYGTRLAAFVVYTRETYPAEQWELSRNKDQNVNVAQPENFEARLKQARTAQAALKLHVPVLVDTIDDATARAYGAIATDAAQLAAVLIARDGTIATTQKWFEPYAMRRAIDATLAVEVKAT